MALVIAGMAEPTPSKRLTMAYGWALEYLTRLGGEASFSFGMEQLDVLLSLLTGGAGQHDGQ